MQVVILGERTQLADHVSLGRLHLDDVRAEIGEDHRAVRAGEHLGEIDDPHAGERSASLGHASTRGLDG